MHRITEWTLPASITAPFAGQGVQEDLRSSYTNESVFAVKKEDGLYMIAVDPLMNTMEAMRESNYFKKSGKKLQSIQVTWEEGVYVLPLASKLPTKAECGPVIFEKNKPGKIYTRSNDSVGHQRASNLLPALFKIAAATADLGNERANVVVITSINRGAEFAESSEYAAKAADAKTVVGSKCKGSDLPLNHKLRAQTSHVTVASFGPPQTAQPFRVSRDLEQGSMGTTINLAAGIDSGSPAQSFRANVLDLACKLNRPDLDDASLDELKERANDVIPGLGDLVEQKVRATAFESHDGDSGSNSWRSNPRRQSSGGGGSAGVSKTSQANSKDGSTKRAGKSAAAKVAAEAAAEAAEATGIETEEAGGVLDVDSLTVRELRVELEMRDLTPKGKKSELQAQLKESVATAGKAAPATKGKRKRGDDDDGIGDDDGDGESGGAKNDATADAAGAEEAKIAPPAKRAARGKGVKLVQKTATSKKTKGKEVAKKTKGVEEEAEEEEEPEPLGRRSSRRGSGAASGGGGSAGVPKTSKTKAAPKGKGGKQSAAALVAAKAVGAETEALAAAGVAAEKAAQAQKKKKGKGAKKTTANANPVAARGSKRGRSAKGAKEHGGHGGRPRRANTQITKFSDYRQEYPSVQAREKAMRNVAKQGKRR